MERVKKVRWFLEHLDAVTDRARFVTEHPHFVLVEIEAGDEQAGSDLGVTERIDAALIQRQSRSSGDARVLPIEIPAGDGTLAVGRSRKCPWSSTTRASRRSTPGSRSPATR